MSHIENVFNLVRARLQAEKVKLWEEPYYMEGVGSIEIVMEELAKRYAQFLGIEVSNCMSALSELQDHALRKLAARREFSETGMATFKVRRIDNRSGTTTMLEIKCDLNSLGSELQAAIAAKLQLSNPQHVKCIASGKMVAPNVTLGAQSLKNNQAVIVIIGQGDNKNAGLYERLNKIKSDVEAVVASQNRLMEMEDQDGNPVFLPPEENRALLLALGFCEKAKAAMQREDYEESLLLLLEGDEKFATCKSSFLESVDNFALLNLDIVWCYMCLKNVSQLPDAEARLAICERSFRRSYGDNFERLYALKGRDCPERALFMRLKLLQGIVLFHQNRRDEAFERFEAASTLLKELKVDEDKLLLLMEMGFGMGEARLALRSCSGSGGNIDQAVQFIQERKKKLSDARKQSKKERKVHGDANRENAKDEGWVNPRSVCTLVEMGFDTKLATLALRHTENDIARALDMLEKNSAALHAALSETCTDIRADENQMAALQLLGFDEATIRAALESTGNSVEGTIEFLLMTLQSEAKLKEFLEGVKQLASDGNDGPSTSSQAQNSSIIALVMAKARELESLKAYERFHSDISQSDQDYLDLPLIHEEQLLGEYRRLLEQ
ncbi:NEDD8 ultimate buster 1 [Drosophila pseudoobscura]|uniref:NEDD8 ultimate buster 1 n=1 Tax=Drosophila pseudoobscura pseudoobscura TaxID=46245 RepID=A0A6I8UF35_DROPS|nr:NEDD8 ultimate buster 1 [Drosophila pseudoobscura]XP_033238787.1 NEDD8 ultimate buster 1 [Drosophila pseudoobscura]XP_033238788.1 NEDD8 ultimate buster 1 [Drosophila pseudoobscura]XP_033238789.1 NEDD8 ultimate buster 1 [Drosophila pseudoobscura]